MKLIATADWHYTGERPSSRIDDYVSALRRKITVITHTAMMEDCVILQSGDLTDTPFLSYLHFRILSGLLHESEIYTIYGQHDLRYRTRGNTPLDALNTVIPSLHLLENPEPVSLQEGVWLYGCSYGEKVPEITTKGFNILLIHRMILGKEKEFWEVEKGYDDGEDFLRKYKFDLIVSGDNHKAHNFSVKSIKSSRHLFNCGSLMRSRTSQLDHEPRFYLIDTDTREYEVIKIPIEPSENVFDLETKVKFNVKNEHLETFISKLSEGKNFGFKVEDDLNQYELDNEISSDLIKIRKEWMLPC